MLDWSARFLDLNIFKSFQEMLARKVYSNGRQYSDVFLIKDAIISAWNGMTTNFIRNLYSSVPSRLASVLEKKGKLTNC